LTIKILNATLLIIYGEDSRLKYLSCRYIEHGLDFEHRRLETCCFTCHTGGGGITLNKNYNGENINWEELFAQKRERREKHKKGNLSHECLGCIFLEEKDWDESDYINYLQFNHWVACNSKCIYCYAVHNREYFSKLVPYNVVPIIKDMIEKKILIPGGEVSFGGGEPTIDEDFEEIVDILTQNGFKNMRIHSSGIKFSPAIERAINAGVLNVVISVDSGNKNLYKKIKQVDCYNKVMENIQKYAIANRYGHGLVTSKYIIIPNINDNIKSIDEWLMETKRVGGKWIALDIEDVWYKMNRITISDYYLDLVNYVIRRAEELGMRWELYDRAKGLKEGQNKIVG